MDCARAASLASRLTIAMCFASDQVGESFGIGGEQSPGLVMAAHCSEQHQSRLEVRLCCNERGGVGKGTGDVRCPLIDKVGDSSCCGRYGAEPGERHDAVVAIPMRGAADEQRPGRQGEQRHQVQRWFVPRTDRCSQPDGPVVGPRGLHPVDLDDGDDAVAGRLGENGDGALPDQPAFPALLRQDSGDSIGRRSEGQLDLIRMAAHAWIIPHSKVFAVERARITSCAQA